jgi:MFS family permease
MPSHKRALALAGCICGNFVDGYGVVAVAFVGKAIERLWHLPPSLLGLVFAAGPAGMVLGSFVIAPAADRVGRRTVALCALLLTALGMAAAALAPSLVPLLAALVLTGMGVGGVLATLNTLVAEIAPPERRGMVMAIFSAGYPLGSTVAGVIAMGLMPRLGWQIVFLLGAALTVAVLLLNLATLPESRVTTARAASGDRAQLLGADRLPVTLGVSLAFFLNMVSFYFVLLWTARMTIALGLPEQDGAMAMTLVNLGSLVGPLIFGRLVDRFGIARVAPIYFVGFGLAIALFAGGGPVPVAIDAMAVLVGLAMGGAMTSLYMLAAQVFPVEIRAAGTGLAIGVGRVGAAIGPMLAGLGLQAGIGRGGLYLLFALPPLCVAVLLASGCALPRPSGRTFA